MLRVSISYISRRIRYSKVDLRSRYRNGLSGFDLRVGVMETCKELKPKEFLLISSSCELTETEDQTDQGCKLLILELKWVDGDYCTSRFDFGQLQGRKLMLDHGTCKEGIRTM